MLYRKKVKITVGCNSHDLVGYFINEEFNETDFYGASSYVAFWCIGKSCEHQDPEGIGGFHYKSYIPQDFLDSMNNRIGVDI